MLESGKRGLRGEPVTRLTPFNDVFVKAKAEQPDDSIQKRVNALGF
jgi:hypothetical protein